MRSKKLLVLIAIVFHSYVYGVEPFGLESRYLYSNSHITLKIATTFAEDHNMVINDELLPGVSNVRIDSLVISVEGTVKYKTAKDSLEAFRTEDDLDYYYWTEPNKQDIDQILATSFNAGQDVYNIKCEFFFSDTSTVLQEMIYFFHDIYSVESYFVNNSEHEVSDDTNIIAVQTDSIRLNCLNRHNCTGNNSNFDCPADDSDVDVDITTINLYNNGDEIKSFSPIITEHSVLLRPGINRIIFEAIDDIGTSFFDSITFFYIKIDENTVDFCASDTYVKLAAIPEGGTFYLLDAEGNVKNGVIGNTNVFNPSLCNNNIDYFLRYEYIANAWGQEFTFGDVIEINLKQNLQGAFIDGPSETCPYTSATYTIEGIDAQANYDFQWKVNGADYAASVSSIDISWQNTMNSLVELEINNINDVCSQEISKVVKVGSNGSLSNFSVDMAVNTSNVADNRFLLACSPSEGATYYWHGPSNSDVTETDLNYLISEGEGSYWVVVETIANRGCPISSDTIDTSTLKMLTFNLADVELYPNPFNNSINIDFTQLSLKNNTICFTIINQLGNIVRQGDILGTKSLINCADLPTGIYLLTLSNGDRSATKTLIKQ